MSVPSYMEKGSQGPAVDIVLKFLTFLTMIRGECGQGLPKIEIDGDYGGTAVAHMKRLQQDLGLEPDGGFGPETRDRLREVADLDFTTACLSMLKNGPTVFVQPDGTQITWSPNDYIRD